MNNPLKNLTQSEKNFIWAVETNRGEIKNQEKYYPILVDIYNNAIPEFKEHLTHSKHIGIGMVHEITDKLTTDEQNQMVKALNDLPKITSNDVKMILSHILTHR